MASAAAWALEVLRSSSPYLGGAPQPPWFPSAGFCTLGFLVGELRIFALELPWVIY